MFFEVRSFAAWQRVVLSSFRCVVVIGLMLPAAVATAQNDSSPVVHSYTDLSHLMRNADFSRCTPAPGAVCQPANDWFRDGLFSYGLSWSPYGNATPGSAVIVAPATVSPNVFGAFGQCFDAGFLGGRNLHFWGAIATSDVYYGYAGLWLRADDITGQPLALNNNFGTGVIGTTGFTSRGISMPIPVGTARVCLGGLLTGSGSAWFDDLHLTAY